MNEIKCPNCSTVFQINEEDYDSIVKQVRDKEFEREINLRDEQAKIDKENAVKIAESKKDIEITNLKNEIKNIGESTKNDLEKKFNDELNKEESRFKGFNLVNKKEIEITNLRNEIKLKDSETKLLVQNAVSEKDKEIDNLSNKLELSKSEALLKEKSIIDGYEDKIRNKDEQIAYYKDFKARQSTKMIGESLETHCHTEFNKLRPLFSNAYFEKDNDAKTGSKGDFIFRDYDDEGTEIVSIMFEMKNEADETATKHKNEDFFKELDKDRKEKNCEYAVLVSLLEIDNEYYNSGIVDVSYKYEKMYVIRPQFFIPLITLIRGLAVNSLKYKKELEVIQNQNIDIRHFEDNMNSFKEAFGRNYRLASERFSKAIEEIDKTIDHLQKTKENLLKSVDNLRLANNKAEDLTIKKLTNGSETMAKMFEELKKEEE